MKYKVRMFLFVVLVENEPSMIDYLSAERIDRKRVPIPNTTGQGFIKFSLGADDFEAQEPVNESM